MVNTLPPELTEHRGTPGDLPEERGQDRFQLALVDLIELERRQAPIGLGLDELFESGVRVETHEGGHDRILLGRQVLLHGHQDILELEALLVVGEAGMLGGVHIRVAEQGDLHGFEGLGGLVPFLLLEIPGVAGGQVVDAGVDVALGHLQGFDRVGPVGGDQDGRPGDLEELLEDHVPILIDVRKVLEGGAGQATRTMFDDGLAKVDVSGMLVDHHPIPPLLRVFPDIPAGPHLQKLFLATRVLEIRDHVGFAGRVRDHLGEVFHMGNSIPVPVAEKLQLLHVHLEFGRRLFVGNFQKDDTMDGSVHPSPGNIYLAERMEAVPVELVPLPTLEPVFLGELEGELIEGFSGATV